MEEKDNSKNALGGAIDMFDSLSLEQIIGSLQDGAILIDRKDKIILLNIAAENILGISASEATGKSYSQVIKAVKATDKIGHKVSPNERAENDNFYLINQKDGRRIPISLHAQILEDTEGNPIGRIEIIREISNLTTNLCTLKLRNCEHLAIEKFAPVLFEKLLKITVACYYNLESLLIIDEAIKEERESKD